MALRREDRPFVRLADEARHVDRYLQLLGLILLTIVASAFIEPGSRFSLVVVALQCWVLLDALSTSLVRKSRLRFAIAATVVAFLVVTVAELSGNRPLAARLYLATMLILIVSAAASIALRLFAHEQISMRTVGGALCVYLLVGMFFATLYATMQFVQGHFFAQIPPPKSPQAVDYVYFSFITITTVGYGDYTAFHDLGRMAAVLEALVGQFYLVTVVSLVVANLGRERTRREPLQEIAEEAVEGPGPDAPPGA